jgi:hypothetical protein
MSRKGVDLFIIEPTQRGCRVGRQSTEEVLPMHTDEPGEPVEVPTSTTPQDVSSADLAEPAITPDSIASKTAAKSSGLPIEIVSDLLAEEAYYGIVGNFVRRIEPHTEADPAALLMMTLVSCGAALGRGPYYVADGARHGVNLFIGIVGESSKSRKGTAWGRVQTLLIQAADAGFGDRIEAGLSTGEGLINLVRDPREDDDDDLGVCDKRLLIVHSEFSSPLKMMRRGGNNLSEIIREAWDGGRLRVATKNSPLKATDPHISIIGHITRDELVERMNEMDAANGFGNRFLWVRARRSKSLPFGGNLDQAAVADLADRLRQTLVHGARAIEYRLNAEARELWAAKYDDLSDAKPGLLGAIMNRAEAQVVRLATLYAALDGTAGEVRADHLAAALAVWDYCARSARWVFGERLGNDVADAILEALRRAPAGLTRTEISDLFCRHKTAAQINTALGFLTKYGHARREYQPTGGAPIERWHCDGSAKNAN